MSPRAAADYVEQKVALGAATLLVGTVMYAHKVMAVGFAVFILYLIYLEIRADPQMAIQLIGISLAAFMALLAVLFAVGVTVERFTSLVDKRGGD